MRAPNIEELSHGALLAEDLCPLHEGQGASRATGSEIEKFRIHPKYVANMLLEKPLPEKELKLFGEAFDELRSACAELLPVQIARCCGRFACRSKSVYVCVLCLCA